jgi:hypothetical protein
MATVLYAVQSFEVFCSLYLRVELAYKPFGRERQAEGGAIPTSALNEVLDLLYEKTRTYTFSKMRRIFLRRVLMAENVASLAAARHAIESLKSIKEEPSDDEINGHPNKEIGALLLAFRDTKLNDLRNRVAHKELYRPSREEAEEAVKVAGDILYPLGTYLGLFADDFAVNWYTRRLDP